jgi:hypothetical protein
MLCVPLPLPNRTKRARNLNFELGKQDMEQLL